MFNLVFPPCHGVSVYCLCHLFPTWLPTSDSFTNQTPESNYWEVGLRLFERLKKHKPFIKMELCTLSYQISQSSCRKYHHCAAAVPMCLNLIYEIGVRFGKYFRFSLLNSECIICSGQLMHHFPTSWGTHHIHHWAIVDLKEFSFNSCFQ